MYKLETVGWDSDSNRSSHTIKDRNGAFIPSRNILRPGAHLIIDPALGFEDGKMYLVKPRGGVGDSAPCGERGEEGVVVVL